MNNTVFIDVEEAGSGSNDEGSVEVILRFHGAGGVDYNSAGEPRRTLSVPKASDREEVAWYLENYLKDPFSTTRAERARSHIDRYSALLVRELQIQDWLRSEQGLARAVLEIHQGPRVSKIFWEALEAPELWKGGVRIHVCRIAAGEKIQLQRAPTHAEAPQLVKILVLVARKEDDAIDPRFTCGPLLQKLRQDTSGSVSVHIARPGTRDEFLRCLREDDYDIVHLDVHGKVKKGRASLLFQDETSDENVAVGADEIGHALFTNRVRLVVMNACQSASSGTDSSTANFAHQLASHGVPYVVGMAYKVMDTAVEIFTSMLYDCLLWKGRDVLSAVSECRAELRAKKGRESGLIRRLIPLQDDIQPVLYATGRQLHRHSMTLRDTSCEVPKVESGLPVSFFGRGLDMLKVENRLLRDRVVVVYGAHGVGKRSLVDELGAWFLDTRLVEHVFHLDGLSKLPTLDSALARIWDQMALVMNTTEWAGILNLNDRVLRALSTHHALLTIKNLDREPPQWMGELCRRLTWRETSEETPSCFVLIASLTPMPSLYQEISRSTGHDELDYSLEKLQEFPAIALAGTLHKWERPGKDSYSVLWYERCILDLLQHNPLAMKVVLLGAKPDSRQVYWDLKAGRLVLDWEKEGKELAERWQHLPQQHPRLLTVLMPFTRNVPAQFLGEALKMNQVEPSSTQVLVAAGCATILDEDDPELELHPLFSQFIRSQAWEMEIVSSSWRLAASYYHDLSIEWIRTGLYSTTSAIQPKDEWENLTSVLYHLIADLRNDTEASSLFDLPWIVCSFHALHDDMPRHAADVFADLTLAALHAVAPDLMATSNESLRLLLDNRLRASRLSDLQILRVTMFVQFLVQYYYDSSPTTACLYQDGLSLLQETALRGGGPQDEVSRQLLDVARSVSFLTEAELYAELGRMRRKPAEESWWHDFSEEMTLPPEFRAFADVWGGALMWRFFGLVLDLNPTLNNLHRRWSTSSLPAAEKTARLQSLDTLVAAFGMLNCPAAELPEQRRRLDEELRTAIKRCDTRTQLDIYEKLAEVYYRSSDFEAVLFVLDKMDECSESLCRFSGINVDEVNTLDEKRWMIRRRAFCLRHLGRIAESNAEVAKLREVVQRREDLWTSRDRSDEEWGSLLEYVRSNLADKPSFQEAIVGDYVFRARTRHRADGNGEGGSGEATGSGEGPEEQPGETGEDIRQEVEDGPPVDESEPVPESEAPGTEGGAEPVEVAEVDNSEELYFIQKPWMRGIIEWMKTLGTPAPAEYYDFQIPPGHIGGLFFSQARAHMAEAFLVALGVLEPGSTAAVESNTRLRTL